MGLGLIALMLLAALLGPALALLSGGAVPIVVGQLVAGVLLGRTGLRIVDPGRSDLALLYDIGFATLMFTVGMHVPLHDERLRSSARQGLKAVGIVVPLAVGAGLLAHALAGGPTEVYAVILASSSAAIALPVIDEAGLSSAPVLAAMTWITAADILATLAIPLALTPSHALHAAVGALIVAALVAAVFLLARRLRHAEWVHRARRTGKRSGWAIDLRLAMIVLVGLAYIAQRVGASILVAGFGTGLVVGAIGGPKRLSREVLGLGQGFLVPLFFVLLGAKLNLRALDDASAILLAVALASLAIGVHVVTAVAIGAPWTVGFLASAEVGVPAAVIALGLAEHAIDQGQASAIFCSALVSIGACSTGAALLRRAAATDVSSAHERAPGPAVAPDAGAPRLQGG